jgi:hypothetical protein
MKLLNMQFSPASYYLISSLYIHSPYTLLLRCRGFHFSLDLTTMGRTPWTSDRPVARPLPKYRTTQTQKNVRTHTHTHTHQTSMPKWDSNPRSQCPSERRQFMPYVRPLGYRDRLISFRPSAHMQVLVER